MISRREFIKETATIGITATAAVAFWNAAPKSVEAYRDYIGERMQAGTPLPRKPQPTGASEVFMQPVKPMGGYGSSWPEMVKNTYYAAGLDAAVEPGDMVILKQHLGERNRESYLRPHNVRSLVTEVKKKGGNPFVCDTMTSYYPSARYNYLNHYNTALSHGYTKETVDCPVIPFSDGRWGADHLMVPIDGNQLNMVAIAQLIAEADALVAFTHAKGHPSGVFGGTLKNLGIGGASAHGKFWDHYLRGNVTGQGDYYPMMITVDPFECPGTDNCEALKSPWLQGDCTRWCPYKAYEVGPNGMTKWSPDVCSRNRCMDYYATCQRILPGAGCTAGFKNTVPWGGISRKAQRANLQIRYTDTAVGCWWLFPEGKAGAVNVAKDNQPWCDCVQHDGLPLTPDIGVLASKDLVAIDQVTLDLYKASPSTPGSRADELGLGAGDDKYEPINGASPYFQTEAGAKLGAGTLDYNITDVAPTTRYLWGDMPFYLHDQADKLRGFTPASEKSHKDPRAFYYIE